MAQKSPKKGPHSVKTASKPKTNEEFSNQELEAEVDAFIAKVHGAIQQARGKMSDEAVEKADKEAEAILKAASAAAKSARRRA